MKKQIHILLMFLVGLLITAPGTATAFKAKTEPSLNSRQSKKSTSWSHLKKHHNLKKKFSKTRNNGKNRLDRDQLKSNAVTDAENSLKTDKLKYKVTKDRTDSMGLNHIYMSQTYEGLPVVGAETIVHIDADDGIFAKTGRYVDNLSLSTVPSVTTELVLEQIGNDLNEAIEDKITHQPSLVIFEGALAYYCEVSDQEVVPPYIWKYYIDAQSGEILAKINDIKFAAPQWSNGSPTVVQGNRLSGEDGSTVSINGWHDTLSNSYYLINYGNLWGVFDANSSDWSQQEGPHWYEYDSAAISAAYNMDTTQEYAKTVLGLSGFGDNGNFIQANVHTGYNYVNAYWDMVDFHFGDGDGVEANALTTLDIVAHEYGHAITTNTSNLFYYKESGALNESFSDIFGFLVEFHNQADGTSSYPESVPGTADWLMGEDCWLQDEALRDMRNPQRFDQPSYYWGSKYYGGYDDNGGVHTNSGLQNHVFYLLSVGGSGENDGHPYGPISGIGAETAGEIAMYANMHLLSRYADFQEARDAWILAAEILGYGANVVQAVTDAWAACGIFENTVPLSADQAVLSISGVQEGTNLIVDYTIDHPFTYDARVLFLVSEDNIIDMSTDKVFWSNLVPAGNEAPYTEQFSITIPNIPSGSYHLGAFIDYGELYPEADETNNIMASANPVAINNLPDWYASDFIGYKSGLVLGQHLEMGMTIRNGSADPAPPVTATIAISSDYNLDPEDHILATFEVPALAGGEEVPLSQLVQIPLDFQPSYGIVIYTVNYDRSIAERAYHNQGWSYGTFVDSEYSDMYLTAVASESTSVGISESLPIDFSYFFQGPGSLIYNQVTFFLSTDTALDETDIALGTGGANISWPAIPGTTYSGTANLNVPRSTPAGQYYIIGSIDYNDLVTESNENNNTLVSADQIEVTETSTSPYDLVVTVLEATITGNKLTPIISVQNQGTETVPATTMSINLTKHIEDYYWNDFSLGGIEIPSLLPGETFSVTDTVFTLSPATPPGTYFISGCADTYGNVQESDENNNCPAYTNLVEYMPVDTPVNIAPDDSATVSSLTPVLESSSYSNTVTGSTHGSSQWQVCEESHCSESGLVSSTTGYDTYMTYELPFTFPYFGRNIKDICYGTNGQIELLEEGEFCSPWSHMFGHFFGDHIGRDVIMAANDILNMTDGYLNVNAHSDHITVEWYGTTDDDFPNIETRPIHFQVEMYTDGTINWNFKQMDYVRYSAYMYSGLANEEGLDLQVVSMNDAQSSYTFDPEIQEVDQVAYRWDTPSLYFLYDSGETTDLINHTVPSQAGLSFNSTYFWRVRYRSDNNEWSPWSVPTTFTTEPLPDLKPTRLEGDVFGDQLSIDLSVKNIGAGPADGSASGIYLSVDEQVCLFPWCDDILVGEINISPLDPGEEESVSTTLTIPESVPYGTYYVFTIVDYDDFVEESDEFWNKRRILNQIDYEPLTNSINITRAEYDEDDEELKVRATSDYGSDANLYLEDFGPMQWRSDKNRWELTVNDLDEDDVPDTITIEGPEGSASEEVEMD